MPTEAARRVRIAAAYLTALRAAVEISGGEAALASAWGVAPELLGSWLDGEVVLPVKLYLAALEMIRAKGEKWKTAGSH
jgi:hypothetical protein